MWFERLVGFAETTGDEVRAKLVLADGVLTSSVNQRQMIPGQLTTPSLAELRANTKAIAGSLDSHNNRGPRLRQIVGDVADLHRDPANAGALFQAASQFNLLEMVSPAVTPEAGISAYESDSTQGPACAVACGAGTIYRAYFVDVDGQQGQTTDRQLNCLADLEAEVTRIVGHDQQAPLLWTPWKMVNGYAMFRLEDLNRVNRGLTDLDAAHIDHLRSLIRIGVQRNTEVTDASPDLATPGHLVSQAYCAALPVAYNRPPPHHFTSLARLILEAAYEATLHAGVLNAQVSGNPTVFLTLLGGGVFGNTEDWILDAIERALASDRFAGTDLDVVVVAYRQPNKSVSRLVERLGP